MLAGQASENREKEVERERARAREAEAPPPPPPEGDEEEQQGWGRPVFGGAANSSGPRGLTGPLGTPWRTLLDPLQIGSAP